VTAFWKSGAIIQGDKDPDNGVELLLKRMHQLHNQAYKDE
jgi:hypothetical protein